MFPLISNTDSPVVEFHPTMQFEPDELCCVCLEGFLENANAMGHAAQSGPKRDVHFFHRECLIRMLSRNPHCGFCNERAALSQPTEEERSELINGALQAASERAFEEAARAAQAVAGRALEMQNRRREALLQVCGNAFKVGVCLCAIGATLYSDETTFNAVALSALSLILAYNITNFFIRRVNEG